MTTAFNLSDVSNYYPTPTVDAKTTVIAENSPVAPTIAGTVSGQVAGVQSPGITPFLGVTVGDPNFGTTDTLTIQIEGGGTLSGQGATPGVGNSYTVGGPISPESTTTSTASSTPRRRAQARRPSRSN